MRLRFFVLSAPLVLIACSASGGSEPTAPGSPSPTPAAAASLNPGLVPADLFNQIVSDAATKAGVDASALTVVQASAVTWSDGSLGCPQPGMSYTQALVSGYRVILESGGTQYDYHASNRGNFVLCPASRAKDPIDDGT